MRGLFQSGLIVLLLALAAIGFGGVSAQAPEPAATATGLYLPLIVDASAPAPAPAPAPPPLPLPPGTDTGAFLVGSVDAWAHNPRLALDRAGNAHLVYTISGATADGPSPAYYAVCAAQARCADPEAWSRVLLGNDAQSVQLALTPKGQPRALIFATADGRGAPITYAACAAQCAAADGWKSAVVATTAAINVGAVTEQTRPFALDAQGRPRFVYYDNRSGMDHAGTFYAFCAADCTDPAAWRKTLLVPDQMLAPTLQITPSGGPRLIAGVTGAEEGGRLIYAACDTNCDDGAQWEGLNLLPLGSGDRSWSLRLDAAGRPRIALALGELEQGGRQLVYLACDTACLSEAQWQAAPVGLANDDGRDPDLALDAQGRPRIAYRSADPSGLGLAWCDTDCTVGAGAWRSRVVERSVQLDADYPIPPPERCVGGAVSGWIGGFTPSIVLDSAGRALIGYDAEHSYASANCRPNRDAHAFRVLVGVPLTP